LHQKAVEQMDIGCAPAFGRKKTGPKIQVYAIDKGTALIMGHG